MILNIGNIKSNFLLLLIRDLIPIISGLFIYVYISRIFSSEAIASIGILNAMMIIIQQFIFFQIFKSYPRFYYDYKKDQKILYSTLLISCLVSLIFFTAVFFLILDTSNSVLNFFNNENLYLIFLVIINIAIFRSLNTIYEFLYIAKNLKYLSTFVIIIKTTIFVISFFIFVYKFDIKLPSLFFSFLLAEFFYFLFGFFYFIKNFIFKFDKLIFSSLIKFSFPLQLSSFANYGFSSITFLTLSKFLPSAILADYFIIERILFLLKFIISSITKIISPYFTQLLIRSRKLFNKLFLIITFRLNIFILFLIFFLNFNNLFFTYIIKINDLEYYNYIFLTLSISYLLIYISSFLQFSMFFEKKTNKLSYIAFIMLLIQIPFVLIFSQINYKLAIFSIVISRSIGLLLTYNYLSFSFKELFNLKYFIKNYFLVLSLPIILFIELNIKQLIIFNFFVILLTLFFLITYRKFFFKFIK